MNPILEVNAQYKLGHSTFKTRCSIIGRNINRIEEIVEEIPDYADGVNARIELPTGMMFLVTDKYDDLVSRWKETLEGL
jgi:hypothetical protein